MKNKMGGVTVQPFQKMVFTAKRELRIQNIELLCVLSVSAVNYYNGEGLGGGEMKIIISGRRIS